MKIRQARGEDAPALTALIMASKQSVGYDDAFMAACADELRVSAELIRKTDFWVVQGPAYPLGCARLDVEGKVGEIHAFFIHPDHKRQGIGRALWEAVLAAAKAKGLTELVLDAEPTAEPFYETLGFRTIGSRPSGSIPGRMLPFMKLSL